MDQGIQITLTNEEAVLKQKMLEALFATITANINLFDPEKRLHAIFDMLIIFNREVLVYMMTNSTLIDQKDELLNKINEVIRTEVTNRLSERIHHENKNCQ